MLAGSNLRFLLGPSHIRLVVRVLLAAFPGTQASLTPTIHGIVPLDLHFAGKQQRPGHESPACNLSSRTPQLPLC